MVKLRYLELEAYTHATEDEAKVLKALKNVVPPKVLTKVRIRKIRVKGHYGNPILIVKARIIKPNLADILGFLSERMEEYDKIYLSKNLDRFTDETGTLYLRFDKQEAYLGRLVLEKRDPICIRLKFKIPFDHSVRVKEYIKELILDSGLLEEKL